MSPDAVFRIAAAQHGIVSRAQARATGLARSTLGDWIRRGRLEPVGPRTLHVPGAPWTERADIMRSVMDSGPGSVASHLTAAGLWEVPGARPVPVHVTHPRGGAVGRPSDIVVHRSRRLPPHHVLVLDAIPVTTPVRTVFDLAAIWAPGRVERALDALWARRLLTGEQLDVALAELARRGRRGIGTMRDLCAARGPGYRPPESRLEARMAQLIASDGQPPMERQVDVGDDTMWLARVDLLDRARRVVLSVNGDRFHRALVDERHDAHRRRELRRAGWVVIDASEHEVWHEPAAVLRALREARSPF